MFSEKTWMRIHAASIKAYEFREQAAREIGDGIVDPHEDIMMNAVLFPIICEARSDYNPAQRQEIVDCCRKLHKLGIK